LEIEHIVFDGGSTDETIDVLKSFSSQLKWKSQKDKGQTDAVNKGILATDGEIIGWLNSDDIYYPRAIEKVSNFFKNHPEVDVIYGRADHIDLEDHAFEEYPTEPFDYERLQFTCFICQPALFLRRNIVEKYGLLDESLNYCMDYEYWLRLAKAGVSFAYLKEKLAGSRLYADNKTLGSRVKVHKEINDMFKQHFGRVPERWIYNYAHAKTDVSIDRELEPIKYQRLIAWHSFFQAIIYNKRITKSMRSNIKQWLFQDTLNKKEFK